MKVSRSGALMPKRMMHMAMMERFGRQMRRGMNVIAHILTPHGKLMAGRKGRKG